MRRNSAAVSGWSLTVVNARSAKTFNSDMSEAESTADDGGGRISKMPPVPPTGGRSSSSSMGGGLLPRSVWRLDGGFTGRWDAERRMRSWSDSGAMVVEGERKD